ncbi:MAG: Ig-like domain-containing protein [Telluria sp.]
MLHSTRLSTFRSGRLLAAGLLALALAACGGGGGSPGTTVGTGTGGTGGTGTNGSGGPTTPATPTVTLALLDGSGKAISSLSGAQTGTLRATVLDAANKPVDKAIVTFGAGNSGLVSFDQTSALTDASGVAVVNVKPASTSAAGATALTANSVVAAQTVQASVNMAVGAAPLTVGALSFASAPSGALPAFSTTQLNIPVTSGGQPASSVSGLTLSSLCTGDGTATIVPGSLSNGVQTATYTNNGCLRSTDTITAAIGNSSQTISLAVSPADIGAINFVSSSSAGNSIVLKGSGGLGRAEAAQLTFKVVDQHNNPLAGVDVNFRPTTNTGGLSVTPAKGTTDASGQVSTVVTSGTIPTPVRVIAEATRSGVTISGLSDALTISTGLPIQRNMSLAASIYNIEGWDYDGQTSTITVRMADQYGNPVSDGAVVNFVTEGGAVASSAKGACTTSNGSCSVDLVSQEFRPTNGRVTVLGFAQGLEDFVDSNGDGQYSCTNYVDASGNVPATYRPLVDTCVSGGEPFTDLGDAFLDTGNHGATSGVKNGNMLDGVYNADQGDQPFPYNHTTYSATGDGRWGINYIRRSMELVFSGSQATLVRQVYDAPTNSYRDWVATDGDPSIVHGAAGTGCTTQLLVFRLYDLHNNPLPFGTTVAAANADKVAPGAVTPGTIPSTSQIGGTRHSVPVKPDSGCANGSFQIVVTTPRGVGTSYSFSVQP